VAPRNTRVVVEDSSKVAQDALDHHLTVILIDKPWNQEIKDQPGLTRVSNDAQVLATLCHTLL
jgi:ribosomal protein L15E